MILDDFLKFSDSQAITADTASTNSIDLGPGTSRDIGTGEPLYVVVNVEVAFTDSGSDSTLSVILEGDSTSTFSPDATETLGVIPALTAAGSTFFYRLDPGSLPLQKRYIQLRYTPNNGNLSTGTVSAYLTSNIQKYTAYAKNYTIS